ncbi:cation:proton antiporter regulatory subunit [Natronomonas halophila]|uniref:cation:proton antiporter regulatory subunit n=1 Tax=Natronomonas halophila TaxID=2747817 RepID=UPI0015B6F9F0|nr:cation:proton antiporter regulatory subunit [Natronomonas halophila]QLD86214.1 cation:proton antiporter regulatory subunit [Natronomonas halophila]
MTVYESDLPGVGKKFEVEIGDDERLVIVIHNTGKREVFHRVGEADSEKLFDLSDRLARQVGSILEGAHFQPVKSDTTETMLDGDSLLEWVNVAEGSDIVGKTLDELDFRNETGASVVSIQRDDTTESNPGPETVIQAGDTLIILGPREACREVEGLAAEVDEPESAIESGVIDELADDDTDA